MEERRLGRIEWRGEGVTRESKALDERLSVRSSYVLGCRATRSALDVSKTRQIQHPLPDEEETESLVLGSFRHAMTIQDTKGKKDQTREKMRAKLSECHVHVTGQFNFFSTSDRRSGNEKILHVTYAPLHCLKKLWTSLQTLWNREWVHPLISVNSSSTRPNLNLTSCWSTIWQRDRLDFLFVR